MKRIFLVEHAVERVLNRRISEAEIKSVIEKPDIKIPTRKGRIRGERNIGGRILRVIYKETPRQFLVITAIWV